MSEMAYHDVIRSDGSSDHYVTTSASPMSLMAITDVQPMNTSYLLDSSDRSVTTVAQTSSDNLAAPRRRTRRSGMRQRLDARDAARALEFEEDLDE